MAARLVGEDFKRNTRRQRSAIGPCAGQRVEAIGEIFNVFNAKNPAGFVNPNRRVNSAANPTQSSSFLQPTEFAGDFQNPEQRVGQIGFRISF